MSDPADLVAARTSILQQIAAAAARSGRDPAAVQVVAVTKTVDVGRIRDAYAGGFGTFAENRVQERQSKAEALAEVRAAWHLVGPLQSNKARRAVELFDAIERDLPAILDLRGIRVDGLMTVGRLVESPEAARPTFVSLRSLSERLRARHPRLGSELSMGMSEDYMVAVEEGATLVRIGRAIFGARPTIR